MAAADAGADFCDAQARMYPDLAAKYAEFGDLYARKLWHQLTERLRAFVADPECVRADGRNIQELFRSFVTGLEERIDQLSLAVIVVGVSEHYYPSRPFLAGELDTAAGFLTTYTEKRGRMGEAAYLVVLMGVASVRLKGGDADACKALIAEGQAVMDKMDGADAVVYSAFYRTRTEYHKARGPAADFYETALRFLAYTPLSSLPSAAQHTLAQDMALAALVGEGVYNFGEVVAHPVLASLTGTPEAWLAALLEAFHHGDIDGFNSIVAANRAAYSAQPALVAHDDLVKQKVALLCLMEMAAKREPSDRRIKFADIAAETRLGVEEVEWLLMSAMQLELIKGTIDEVDQEVNVTYVRPRVLDKSQIETLRGKIATWGSKTHETMLFVEDHTRELFA